MGTSRSFAAPSLRRGKLRYGVLSEGYVDQDEFIGHVNFMFNALFAAPGFSGYSSLIEIVPLFILSRSPGMDGPLDDRPFRTIYNGRAAANWITVSDETMERVVTESAPHQLDRIAVILNHGEHGGCEIDGVVFFTAYSDTGVLAHECGHQFGDLFDEYGRRGQRHSGADINCYNCSTYNDGRVAWSSLLNGNTVSIIEGCNYCERGAFRPSNTCRMRNYSEPRFCGVCGRSLLERLEAEIGRFRSREGYHLELDLRINDKTIDVLRALPVRGDVDLGDRVGSGEVLSLTAGSRVLWIDGVGGKRFSSRGFLTPRPDSDHNLQDRETTWVRAHLSGALLDHMLKHNVDAAMDLYRLDSRTTCRLTIDGFEALKQDGGITPISGVPSLFQALSAAIL